LLGLRARRKPVPDVLARALSWALPRLPLPNGLNEADLTQDAERREAHARDRLVNHVATPRWYWSSTLAGRAAQSDAALLTLPLLVVQGELDPIVDPASVADFYARASSPDKRHIIRPGELHEVLNERGRLELYALIASWIECVSAA
jgi:alpha-beta hydrolase superfamily lysophospholipase